MRRIHLLQVGLLAFAISGCAAAVSPVGNAVVTVVKGPIGATTGTDTSKTGTACAKNILGIVATGDASIDAAKRQGGIQSVTSVDHDTFTVLSVYASFCTVVRGN